MTLLEETVKVLREKDTRIEALEAALEPFAAAAESCGCVLQTEANAALIAAAPDLLALVEAVEFDADGFCLWCGGWGHAPDCPRQRALEQAQGGGAED